MPQPRGLRPARRWPLVVAALAAALAVPAACSGEEDPAGAPATVVDGPEGTAVHRSATDVTTNPVAQDTGPGIDRFEAPATVSCDGPTAQVPLVWEAPAAEVVRLLVDGDDVGGDQPTSGTTTVDVPCDESIHVVLLAAVGADGATSVRSEAVLAEPEG